MQSVTEIVVRYAETDRMGIAHHANYLVWFEQARTEYTRKLSCSYSELEKQGLLSPLLSVEVHYLRTCTYEDRLQVICRLVKLSQAQMTFAYTVLREGEKQPICTGITRHAWVDAETFRPVSLKRRCPELYQELEQLVEPE